MAIAEILSEYSHNNPGAIPPDVVLEYSGVPFTVKQRVQQTSIAQQQQQQANLEADREVEIMKIHAGLKEAQMAIEAQKQLSKETSK